MIRYYTIDGGYLDVDQTMEMAENTLAGIVSGRAGSFIKYREGMIRVEAITTIVELEG